MPYKPTVIRNFKGLSQTLALTAGSPEYALDCINVLPSIAGLAKLRIPTTLSPAITGIGTGPDQFAMFSGNTKAVLGFFGQQIYVISLDDFTPTILDSNAAYAGAAPWSVVMSNNFAFMQNGTSIPLKYTGTGPLEFWGIAPPATAPTVSTGAAPSATPVSIVAVPTAHAITELQRNSGVSVVFTATPVPSVKIGDTVIIANVTGDPSFNGSFVVAFVDTTSEFGWYQTGYPDADDVSGTGTCSVGSGGGISRQDNEVTVVTTAAHGLAVGNTVAIAGVTDATFDGTFQVDSIVDTVTFTYAQTGPTALSGGGTETPNAQATYTAGGRRYRVSYVNSVTQHVSTASDVSNATGNMNGTIAATITVPASTDSQVDSAKLWSTLDGGADYFLNQTITFAPLAVPTFLDTLTDAQLDQSQREPLINNVPPMALYTQLWGGRIFMFNLPNENKKWVAYTGYNKIFVGRPEESCPPGNRIKLETGADAIAGGGVIEAGVITFDVSDKMFMFRGQPEDITIDAPVEFTLYMKQLPWKIGCASHFTIQSTPRGLVWLSSSLDVFLFNGQSEPLSIDEGAEPILRSITFSQVQNSRSVYWQYKGRNWYVLGIPTGSTSDLTKLLIFDLDSNVEKSFGIVPLDVGAFQSLGIVEMQDGEQKLVIGQGGLLKELTVTPSTQSGIEQNITATSGTLGAFWQGGYIGNDNPQVENFYRWGRVQADQAGIRVKRRIIHNDVTAPEIIEFVDTPVGGKIATNRKGRRMSYELRFRDEDVSQNILELLDMAIPLAER